MSDQRDKLEALSKQLGLKTGAQWAREREAQAQPAPPDASPEGKPDTGASNGFAKQKDMLRALSERLKLMSGTQCQQEREALEEQRAAGVFEIGKILSGTLIGDDSSGFFLRRQDFPLDYRQGILELGAALASSSKHIAFSANDPDLEGFDPRTTVFMDTETSGLAGGAGTVTFLVGLGYFIGDAFRLDQCFMRDYDDEPAMLEFLADLLPRFTTVAGYNSKSFDLPLLRTRFVQNRIPYRMDAMLHYDLVHAARRFWKRRLADCSLGNIEREVLGIRREGDVPSHLIPEIWFDYLNTRDARPLRGVFYHHQMDILSLVTLTGWLSQCLAAPSGQGFEHLEDRLSLVRLHFRQKNYPEVVQQANAFLESEERGPLRRECLEMLGMACKRLQRWLEMEQAWDLLLEEFPSDHAARLELAKHQEHRRRNLFKAEKLCAEGLELLNAQAARIRDDMFAHAVRKAFARRLERIRRKLRRARGTATDDACAPENENE